MTSRKASMALGGNELSWVTHQLDVNPSLSIKVQLHRRTPAPSKATRLVLLVPGANSSCKTFTMPNGGFVAHLAARGCDVWMLDWRVSPVVLNGILERPISPAAIEV